MEQARMQRTDYGLTPMSDGWFVVNVRDAAWMTSDAFGQACVFEGDAVSFRQIGYTIAVLAPGQANGMYHREEDQEDFLILFGECRVIIEDDERRLRAWDFVHCPAGTEHIFVGAGEGPCVIFMAGARTHRGSAVYPRSQSALRRGAGVESETHDSDEAYARFPSWRAGPPSSFDGLPFA